MKNNFIQRAVTGVLFVIVLVGCILYSPLSFGILFTIISALIIYFLFKDICDMVLGFVDIFGAILSGDEGNIQDVFTNSGKLFTDIFEI